MTKEQIISRFKEKPYMLDMGAGRLAKWLNATRDVIIECKAEVRENINTFGTTYNPKDVAFKPKRLKILILDIETSPMRAYVWKRWKENISLPQTISEWFMISYAAKFVGEDKIYSNKLSSTDSINENDFDIVYELSELINQSDVIIAHNLRGFDLPRINTRMIMNDLPPVKPVLLIDTLDVVKKQFAFSSNKLDALAGYFGIKHKESTSFDLWANCMIGDKKSLDYMEFYNRGDVEILEQVYSKLRPYIKNHPNEALISNIPCCPNCGSEKIDDTNEYYYTNVGKYKLYRCDCGAISRSRKSEKTDIALTSNIR